ncbi:hypothetical protein DV515_00008063 [Chloebia gouldiae]|uniref:WAP domain-containing protein n=1 Tax=Chloebia gouldiae TaxID=44316 RepID=A0A3L8SGT7_CHLGU|nr:hypothetical protein DV515_00008063 [Chloebia gouldiae]
MRLCAKIFAAALCALAVLPQPGCARTRWKRALLKMTEKYDVQQEECIQKNVGWRMMGRREDEELAWGVAIHPEEGFLDWLVQPKPRWLGGNGWLLDGPEEVLQAEACSTTEDGDEPLHCPTGYECHIINPGNTAEGIPNRGQCIKLRGNPGSNSNNLVGYVKNQQKHLG